MKKRAAALLMASLMVLGSQAVVFAEDAAEHIIVTYVTLGTTPTDILEVQNAVNEITVPEIGVEVEFEPIAISDTFTNYSTWIAGGDQVDLMMLCFQDPSNYINSGSIYELDELLAENAPTISELAKTYPIFDGAKANGEIFGVQPVLPTYGQTGNIMLRKDWFDELGIEEKDVYTWEELTEIFAGVKANHPESYPLGVLGSDVTTSTSLYDKFAVIDTLGSGINTGVLLSTDSTEVVNLFATEEYYNFLVQMKEWFDAGYIMTDAATTDSTFIELTNNNITASAMSVYSPERYADYANGFAQFGGAVALKTTEVYSSSASGSTGTFWTVPVTSENPEAAVKFLDLTYSNYDLMNLIQWGIEGKHYVKTEAEGIIAFAEGVDPNNSGYYNTLGLWGDRRGQYFWSDLSNREQNDAFTATALGNPTKARGYSYNSADMTNQVVAINSVLQQYLPALETGSVSDLEGTYQAMLSALESAGINDVIADNQAQFDAWLAEQE